MAGYALLSSQQYIKLHEPVLTWFVLQEARMLVSTAYQTTEKLLLDNKDKLKLVSYCRRDLESSCCILSST